MLRRSRRPVVILLVGIALLAVTSPARAEVPRGRFGVGDSIMLSAADELAGHGFGVNAEVGRRFAAGVDVVRSLAGRGTLPRHVIVHLGTNGPVTAEECAALVAQAPHRQVYLVNVRVPRDWETSVNETLRTCAAAYARVHLLNWWRKSGRQPELWLADDGYHLTAEGRAVYAAWIDARVDAAIEARRASR